MGKIIRPNVPQWDGPIGPKDEVTDLADKIHRLIYEEDVNLVNAIVALRLCQKAMALTIGAANGSESMHRAMQMATEMMEKYDCNLVPAEE